MKLYELAQNYKNILDLLDDSTISQEEITAALTGLEETFDIKAENIAKLIKSLEADIIGLKTEEKRLSDRRKALDNRVSNLKEYLTSTMMAIGKVKIKGSIFTLAFQKNPPSAYITDLTLLDKKYFIEQLPTIDKKMILEDLKNDIKIQGAEIKQESSLIIR